MCGEHGGHTFVARPISVGSSVTLVKVQLVSCSGSVSEHSG